MLANGSQQLIQISRCREGIYQGDSQSCLPRNHAVDQVEVTRLDHGPAQTKLKLANLVDSRVPQCRRAVLKYDDVALRLM